jgi:bifunctional non-homologous end joining protein LigD
MIKHRDAWSGEVNVLEVAPQSVKSWGGLGDVLAEAGVPEVWKKSPPVKSGDTAAHFRAVIEEAMRKSAAKKSGGGSKGKAAKPPISADLPAGALSLVGKKPKFTNLDKPLYPGGFTKGQVIDYYTRIAPCMLPHLRGRATTLKRYPDGVEGEVFFEKRCPSHRPEWVETAEVEHSSGKRVNYCVINDLPTLLWTANLAALELHVPLALAADSTIATSMVFDLDPGAPAGLEDCARVGLRLRDMLKNLGLESVAKLSGGKGVHMYVPLNSPGITFEQTKHFSRAIATLMQRDDPTRITASMSKSLRGGRVFIDWSQNDQQKTTACVYTMRGTAQPRVSMPVTWGELEKPKKLPVPSPETAIKRCGQLGDLFRPLLELVQALPAAAP